MRQRGVAGIELVCSFPMPWFSYGTESAGFGSKVHDFWMSTESTLLSGTLISIEIAVIALIIAWLQLNYAQRRDRELDIRNGWSETHKLMVLFRFKRELLNMPNLVYPQSEAFAIAALEALHVLKGQLDRLPDLPMVKDFADFLHENIKADDWRSKPFEQKFDEFAHQIAVLAQPTRFPRNRLRRIWHSVFG
jgi:hypothetical protein